MALVSRIVRYLSHLPHLVVSTLVGVVIERIAADEAIKAIKVRTEVIISASKTKVPRVGQTSSPTLTATVADQMQIAPTANAKYLPAIPINPSRHLLCLTQVHIPHLSTGK
jgi:hypothetical protein